MKQFKSIVHSAAKKGTGRVVVAGGDDPSSLQAVQMAMRENMVEAILVGDAKTIQRECGQMGFHPQEIVDAQSPQEIAEKSVRAIHEKGANTLMKGSIKTADLLRAVLDKQWGLRKAPLLSHAAVLDVPILDRLIFVTDGGMVIHPTLEEKVTLIRNAVELAMSLGIPVPRVACITAVEVVNPSMPETLDAALLAKMNERGQIPDCVVEGPLGIDIALSERAAKIKKVESVVAGKADILLVPDIHSGNFLGKSVEYIGGGTIAGLIMGAQVPVVIVSRADQADAKLASLALATLMAPKQGGNEDA